MLELLSVIAILGVLFGLLLPVLGRAKAKAQTVPCASNMKNWAYATLMYLNDHDDRLPLFGDASTNYSREFWHAKLSRYLARSEAPGSLFSETQIYNSAVRKCPAGNVGRPPFTGSPRFSSDRWNCWIGANFGGYGEALNAPFFYGDHAPPLHVSGISKAADAMIFMDTYSHYVYSPAHPPYRFARDFNGDGDVDMGSDIDIAFNAGRPDVHEDAANVTLLDGHVERVPFRSLWRVDQIGNAAHSFWFIHD